MSLKEQITEDMKAAMRAKETAKLGTIRLLTAAIKQKEVDERIEVSDAQVLAIIEKMIKQRKDSISQFEAGGRQDLADAEKAELVILSVYMPAGLSEAEIKAEIEWHNEMRDKKLKERGWKVPDFKKPRMGII